MVTDRHPAVARAAVATLHQVGLPYHWGQPRA